VKRPLRCVQRQSAAQRVQLGLYLGYLLAGADRLVGVDRFPKRRACGSSVSDGARDLAQLTEHLGVQQTILGALRLEDRDAKCGDALVQRPTLAPES